MSETYATAAEAAKANPPAASAATAPVVYVNASNTGVAPASETLTAESAGDLLTAYRAAESDSRSRSISADFANAIDEMRADMLHGGVKPAAPQAAAPVELEQVPGLEPDLATALAHPQVRDAIESELNQTAATRQAYSTGLDNAMAFSQAALMELMPAALQSVPHEHFMSAMAHLASVDPVRHQSIVRLLDNVLRIQGAKLAEEAHTQVGRAEWAKAENWRFEKMVGPHSPEFGAEMVEYAQELGVPQNQLVHLMKTEPVLQSAAFQKVIYDAVQLRIAQKKAAGGWKNNKARAPIPPVQKPGTSQPRGAGNAERTKALDNQLSRTGSTADAFKLLMSKRGKNG